MIKRVYTLSTSSAPASLSWDVQNGQSTQNESFMSSVGKYASGILLKSLPSKSIVNQSIIWNIGSGALQITSYEPSPDCWLQSCSLSRQALCLWNLHCMSHEIQSSLTCSGMQTTWHMATSESFWACLSSAAWTPSHCHLRIFSKHNLKRHSRTKSGGVKDPFHPLPKYSEFTSKWWQECQGFSRVMFIIYSNGVKLNIVRLLIIN